MRMFATYDLDLSETTALWDYYLTVEEAVAALELRKKIDADGEHEGWEFLGIRIVERESQPCSICDRQASNSAESYAKYPYCRSCHYMGSAAEAIHGDDLEIFYEAFDDISTVDIEHTGGGCFWLAFYFKDELIYYTATDGDASIPDDWENGWGFLGRFYYDPENPEDYKHPDYEGTEIVIEHRRKDGEEYRFSPQDIIDAIKKDRAQLKEEAWQQ